MKESNRCLHTSLQINRFDVVVGHSIYLHIVGSPGSSSSRLRYWYSDANQTLLITRNSHLRPVRYFVWSIAVQVPEEHIIEMHHPCRPCLVDVVREFTGTEKSYRDHFFRTLSELPAHIGKDQTSISIEPEQGCDGRV